MRIIDLKQKIFELGGPKSLKYINEKLSLKDCIKILQSFYLSYKDDDEGFRFRNSFEFCLCSKWQDYYENEKECFLRGDYIVEEKINGVRVLLTFFNKKLRVFGREFSNQDFFPFEYTEKICMDEIEEEIFKRGFDSFVLDGEFFFEDKISNLDLNVGYENKIDGSFVTNVSSFVLKSAKKKLKANQYNFYLFDILYLNKEDLKDKICLERKEILKNFNFFNFKVLDYKDSTENNILSLYRDVLKKGGEGIIYKNKNLCYLSGRKKYNWIKRKGDVEVRKLTNYKVFVLSKSERKWVLSLVKGGEEIGIFNNVNIFGNIKFEFEVFIGDKLDIDGVGFFIDDKLCYIKNIDLNQVFPDVLYL